MKINKKILASALIWTLALTSFPTNIFANNNLNEIDKKICKNINNISDFYFWKLRYYIDDNHDKYEELNFWNLKKELEKTWEVPSTEFENWYNIDADNNFTVDNNWDIYYIEFSKWLEELKLSDIKTTNPSNDYEFKKEYFAKRNAGIYKISNWNTTLVKEFENFIIQIKNLMESNDWNKMSIISINDDIYLVKYNSAALYDIDTQPKDFKYWEFYKNFKPLCDEVEKTTENPNTPTSPSNPNTKTPSNTKNFWSSPSSPDDLKLKEDKRVKINWENFQNEETKKEEKQEKLTEKTTALTQTEKDKISSIIKDFMKKYSKSTLEYIYNTFTKNSKFLDSVKNDERKLFIIEEYKKIYSDFVIKL